MSQWSLRQFRRVAVDGQGRIAQELQCPACQYDLRGRSEDERCPECGEEIERAFAAAINPKRWHWMWDMSALGAMVVLLVVLTTNLNSTMASYPPPPGGQYGCIQTRPLQPISTEPAPPGFVTKLVNTRVMGLVWPVPLCLAFACACVFHRQRKTPA